MERMSTHDGACLLAGTAVLALLVQGVLSGVCGVLAAFLATPVLAQAAWLAGGAALLLWFWRPREEAERDPPGA
jgi:hypothetical protein